MSRDEATDGNARMDEAAHTDDDQGRSVTSFVRAPGLVSALIWAGVALVWGEGPFALTYDDAYYYLEIARHFADGQGSTFDGLNSTNGYHPLWMLICAVPFLVGFGAMAALRAVLVLQVLMWAGTWWIIGGLVGRNIEGWPKLRGDHDDRAFGQLGRAVGATAAIVALNPTIARIGISGLESGLVLMCGAAIIARVTQGSGRFIEGRSTRWRAATGVLLALAVLSRTDHVLLVAAVVVAIAFEPRNGRSLADQIRLAVPLLAIPAVVTGAYLLSNVVIFGSLMQISGEIKRRPLTPALAIVALVVGAVVLLIIRGGSRPDQTDMSSSAQDQTARRVRPPRLPRTKRFASATAWYGAFCLGLVVYYTLFQVQQWLWYFAPPLLLITMMLLLFVADLLESALDEAPEGHSVGRVVAPFAILLGLPLLVGLVMQWRSFTDPEIRSIQIANREAARWMSDELPEGAVVASWDAGALGYFGERPVVNIDGVVNSREWLDATRAGAEAVGRFLDDEGVTHIVNHGHPTNGHDQAIIDYVAKVFGPDRAEGTVLVESFPFVYAGATVGSQSQGSGGREMAVFVYEIPPPPG